MPQAGEVESFKPRCKDVEEIRVQLLGTGPFTGFKSGMFQVLILNGIQLLRFLARASQEALLISVPSSLVANFVSTKMTVLCFSHALLVA